MAVHTANDEASSATVRGYRYTYPTAFINDLLTIFVQNGWARCYGAEYDVAPAHVAKQGAELPIGQVAFIVCLICRRQKSLNRLRRAGIRIPLSAAFLGAALLLFVREAATAALFVLTQFQLLVTATTAPRRPLQTREGRRPPGTLADNGNVVDGCSRTGVCHARLHE